jgi:hypothetical protein
LRGWRNRSTGNRSVANPLSGSRRRWRHKRRRYKRRRSRCTFDRCKPTTLRRSDWRWRHKSRRRRSRSKIPFHLRKPTGSRFSYRRRKRSRYRSKSTGLHRRSRSSSTGKALRKRSKPRRFLHRRNIRCWRHISRWWRGRWGHSHTRSTSATKDRRAIQRGPALAAKISHCLFHPSLSAYSAR